MEEETFPYPLRRIEISRLSSRGGDGGGGGVGDRARSIPTAWSKGAI